MAYYTVEIDGKFYGVDTKTLEVFEIKKEKVISYPERDKILIKALEILRQENKPI
jgi:hypothetical protein